MWKQNSVGKNPNEITGNTNGARTKKCTIWRKTFSELIIDLKDRRVRADLTEVFKIVKVLSSIRLESWDIFPADQHRDNKLEYTSWN